MSCRGPGDAACASDRPDRRRRLGSGRVARHQAPGGDGVAEMTGLGGSNLGSPSRRTNPYGQQTGAVQPSNTTEVDVMKPSTLSTGTGRRRGTRTRLSIGAVAIAMVAAGAVPAHATIVERDRISGSYDFSFDDCGFEVQVHGSYEDDYRIREGKAQANDTATPFFFMSRSTFEETLTGNGTTITVRGGQTYNEIKATYVEDAVFEFVRQVAENVALYDANGKLVARDRGIIRFTYTFDKQDHPREPGGEFIELIDVQTRGPRDLENLSDEDFCALFH
jgi:hypothetical protein